MRLGYLGQELRARQRTVWAGKPLEVRAVRNCLQEIERTLHMLGARLACYQGATFAGLRDRVSARHDGASGHLVQMWMETLDELHFSATDALRELPGRVSSDSAIRAWSIWQDEGWEEINSLLRGVMGSDLRPWFVTGDHLGDMVFQLVDNRLAPPLSPQHWDYLYEGVDRLPEPIRGRVESTFPRGYRSITHLGLQFVSTFDQLCVLLAEEGPQVPYWDGQALWFQALLVKQFAKPAHNQRTALAAFQRQGWPCRIRNPFRLGHSNRDRAIETCKRAAEDLNDHHDNPNVIRFGHAGNGDYMTWRLGEAVR